MTSEMARATERQTVRHVIAELGKIDVGSDVVRREAAFMLLSLLSTILTHEFVALEDIIAPDDIARITKSHP